MQQQRCAKWIYNEVHCPAFHLYRKKHASRFKMYLHEHLAHTSEECTQLLEN